MVRVHIDKKAIISRGFLWSDNFGAREPGPWNPFRWSDNLMYLNERADIPNMGIKESLMRTDSVFLKNQVSTGRFTYSLT